MTALLVEMAKAMVLQGLLLALLLLAFSTLSSAVPDRTARQVPSTLGIEDTQLDELLNAASSTTDEASLVNTLVDSLAGNQNPVSAVDDISKLIQMSATTPVAASLLKALTVDTIPEEELPKANTGQYTLNLNNIPDAGEGETQAEETEAQEQSKLAAKVKAAQAIIQAVEILGKNKVAGEEPSVGRTNGFSFDLSKTKNTVLGEKKMDGQELGTFALPVGSDLVSYNELPKLSTIKTTATNIYSHPVSGETKLDGPDLEALPDVSDLVSIQDIPKLVTTETIGTNAYQNDVAVGTDDEAQTPNKIQLMGSPAQIKITPSELEHLRRSASPLHGVLRLLQQRLNDQQSKQQQQIQQRRHAIRARLQHLFQQRRSAVQAKLKQKQQQRRHAALKLLAAAALLHSRARSNE
eukprot:scpid79188/ scgid5978/ 